MFRHTLRWYVTCITRPQCRWKGKQVYGKIHKCTHTYTSQNQPMISSTCLQQLLLAQRLATGKLHPMLNFIRSFLNAVFLLNINDHVNSIATGQVVQWMCTHRRVVPSLLGESFQVYKLRSIPPHTCKNRNRCTRSSGSWVSNRQTAADLGRPKLPRALFLCAQHFTSSEQKSNVK